MKTNTAYSSRMRVTKSGKILGRKRGQNHFNAKHPRRKELKKHKPVEVKMTNRQQRRFLPNS